MITKEYEISKEYKFHAYETITPSKKEQKEIAEIVTMEVTIEDRELFTGETLEFKELLTF